MGLNDAGTLICRFFKINTCIVFDPQEFADAEGQLHALIYTILYRGLEHLWILAFVGVGEPIRPWIPRDHLSFWVVKLYTDLRLHEGQHP